MDESVKSYRGIDPRVKRADNGYVMGLVFNEQKDRLWLIEKVSKPGLEYMAGRLNGVGGKIDLGETPSEAMNREAREEFGINTDEKNWRAFSVLYTASGVIHCFFTTISDFLSVKKQEVETPIMVLPRYLPENVMPNLTWLVPMALSFERGESADRFIVSEVFDVD